MGGLRRAVSGEDRFSTATSAAAVGAPRAIVARAAIGRRDPAPGVLDCRVAIGSDVGSPRTGAIALSRRLAQNHAIEAACFYAARDVKSISSNDDYVAVGERACSPVHSQAALRRSAIRQACSIYFRFGAARRISCHRLSIQGVFMAR